MEGKMIERFEGKDGRRLVVEALRTQLIIGDELSLAEQIADSCEIVSFMQGDMIIQEAASDNEIYFILSGNLSIRVGGREVAVRSARRHVGEMALIDPAKQRSASVVALDTVVVARVSEPEFTAIADNNPRLWRNIAREMGDRLRQRNRFVEPMNPRPGLFVGCSVEALPIARELQSGLSHDPIIVKVWTDSIFGASRFPIEDLEREISNSDFAALVLAADDIVISRHNKREAPRDNVIFELGLFMGALHRQRTFLVCPRNTDLKIPTDLLGIKPLLYTTEPSDDLSALIAPVCNELRKIIQQQGPR